MTDTSSLAITHATTDSYQVHAHRGSPAAGDGAASDSGAPEEEPYTMKCICSFEEDDGSTVFCEACDSWQHISCYYPDKKVPEVHNCVDCEPRPLDNRRAHEQQRQRRIREKSEDSERKSKRSATKSRKRKSKGTDATDTGVGHDSGSRGSLPVKKQRTSRRPSTSTSVVSGPSGPSTESRNRRSSTSVAMSPTNTSTPSIPLYSNEFLSLYDRDDQFIESNSILNDGVEFVNEIVAWLNDPLILARVTDGLSVEDFAQRSEAALDQSRWPSLKTKTITDSSIQIGDKHPIHKILTTQDTIRPNETVGEIFGTVGHVKDYKKLDSNRWEELHHALPFVFFNRQLDLYIDSRQEGNELRYIRRSCDPNVVLKIYITSGRQLHFCFVAKREIPANTEITTMWYFDDYLFSENASPTEQNKDKVVDPNDAAVCISNTLALFGGCACGHAQRGHPDKCVMERLDRREKPQPPGKVTKSKAKNKPKKGKARGGPSRATSETTKHPDDNDPAADIRSTSGSTRDRHTGSRDISPMTSQEQKLPELSSREKRKIAEAEKQFEQLAHGPVNSRRRRRPSGYHRPAMLSSSTQTSDDFRPYHKPCPSLPLQTAEQSAQRHGTYVDAQTQLWEDDIKRSFQRVERKRRGYDICPVHPTKLKLARFRGGNHNELDWEQRRAWRAGDRSVIPRGVIPWWSLFYPSPEGDRSEVELLPEDAALMHMPLDHGPISMPPRWSFHVSQYPPPPVCMGRVVIRGLHLDRPPKLALQNIDTPSPTSADWGRPRRRLDNDPRKPLSTYWPSIAAHTYRIPGAAISVNVQVSMAPPNMPSAASPGSVSTGSLASPLSHTASPLSLVPASAPALAATPAKKKLSLGDYMIRRGTMATTPTPERTHAPVRPPASGPASLRAEHFLAIVPVFDENHESHRPKVEVEGNKDEMDVDVPAAVAKDLPEEDAPQPQPSSKAAISS
ncbi:Zinc finger FYVE/PHD-type [Penicillium bovifimosum]|uniref:Zinc finger FYVE/PHD-type n=1 Tax=Penicillium bovifimosum TaxID=126998 RepID=A0A9W9GM65_9EURO|nr:Zinc finger FYVE/PHD-type [Penicillium bovifimosum]KAJ5124039.1 Zinc finger FYVE/PHD-type [Penicillium bovifimosum]